MQTATKPLPSAAAATADISRLLQSAQESIKEDAYINGFGIYQKPTILRLSIGAAIDELEKAYALLKTTSWPTDADYDAE